MAKKHLIYDLETRKAIPPKYPIRQWDNVEYCGGWNDFSNMGISCIAYALIDNERLIIERLGVSLWDTIAANNFLKLATSPTVFMGGFNTRKFDDLLLQANHVQLDSSFDILTLILECAGVSGTEYWKRGLRYNLANIAVENGLSKTGDGAEAPILYQTGQHTELLKYCLNDALIEAEILIKLLKGDLLDPNSMVPLKRPDWAES
jgi:hypothetical protein